MDSTIRNGIVEVNKTYYDKTTSSTLTQTDTIWIPSSREIKNTVESSGATYITKFDSATSRIKKRNNAAQNWWLRTASNSNKTSFWSIDANGNSTGNYANSSLGIALGFCTNG